MGEIWLNGSLIDYFHKPISKLSTFPPTFLGSLKNPDSGLQTKNSTFFEFKVAFYGLHKISYFSDVHKLQWPVFAEYGAALANISNLIS